MLAVRIFLQKPFHSWLGKAQVSLGRELCRPYIRWVRPAEHMWKSSNWWWLQHTSNDPGDGHNLPGMEGEIQVFSCFFPSSTLSSLPIWKARWHLPHPPLRDRWCSPVRHSLPTLLLDTSAARACPSLAQLSGLVLPFPMLQGPGSFLLVMLLAAACTTLTLHLFCSRWKCCLGHSRLLSPYFWVKVSL